MKIDVLKVKREGEDRKDLNLLFFLRHIQIHKYEVADTSAHHKQMKDLVRTEVLMLFIKERQFQGVDDAARRVDDAACQKPQECAA